MQASLGVHAEQVDDFAVRRQHLTSDQQQGRSFVVDSDGRPVAVIELTGVRVVPLARVDLAHVVAEGEGDTSVAEWREGHERFWRGEEMRAALDDPDFTVDGTTPVVRQRFRLVTDLRGAD
ncbi:ASCH domain-containing protein [Streptomyces bungoensis]|uniref:ASCH domain-containing protein n=1 Tax=Streptomyces bungoensis TaxID=285568 RepID=UPI000D14C0BC|nr:ASCH domain-containing protein [Streptomyces bungoensis]